MSDDESRSCQEEYWIHERTFFGVKHYRIHNWATGEYFNLPVDGSNWGKLWDEGKILPEFLNWENGNFQRNPTNEQRYPR
jgi:hypothetical protein